MWKDTFKRRMFEFGKEAPEERGIPFSIKIRVIGGCFHREHSPRAYEIIDKYLSALSKSDCYFRFEEHESGPEILVYLALASGGITLTASIINLIVAVLKARSEGISKGDRPHESLEIIIRRIQKNGEFIEEKIMRIGNTDLIDKEKIKKELKKSARKEMDERDDKT